MIPDSFIVRHGIYLTAVLQTAIAPLAFVYYVYYFAADEPLFCTGLTLADTFMHYWLGCELIFYVYFQITWNRMQCLLPSVAPDAKGRRQLFHNCINSIHDADDWLTGWFMKSHDATRRPAAHEICRENIAEWIAWAFFAAPLENVLEDPDNADEVYWMVDNFQRKFYMEIKPGYNDDVVALRLTLDPVQAYHRPLAFYVAISIMTACISRFFFQMHFGFSRYGPEIPSSLSLWWLIGGDNGSDCLSTTESLRYWFRDGDRAKKPVVFIHGIGPGFMPYLHFLYNLLRLSSAPMFCVELPHVAMCGIEQSPTMQDTVRDLERMLHSHGFGDAVFVAHSLGTGVISWAVQHLPKSVAAIVMLDPICFMLHYRDICFNFVYRIPKTATESIVKFFASTELYISYYISRHFHWFQLALYVTPSFAAQRSLDSPTTIMPQKTKVFLSEYDNIVNSERVHDYLCARGIDSSVMHGLDHGYFLAKTEWQKEILETIIEYTCSDEGLRFSSSSSSSSATTKTTAS